MIIVSKKMIKKKCSMSLITIQFNQFSTINTNDDFRHFTKKKIRCIFTITIRVISFALLLLQNINIQNIKHLKNFI